MVVNGAEKFVVFLRFAAVLVCIAVTFFGLVLQLPELADRTLVRNSAWIERAEREPRNSGTDRLLRSAVHFGVIHYDPALDQIVMLDARSYAIARHDNDPRLSANDTPAADLLDVETVLAMLSRGTGAGQELRQIIARANRDRLVLAIRDKGLTEACRAVIDQQRCPAPNWAMDLDQPGPPGLAGAATRLGPATVEGYPDPNTFLALANARGATGLWKMLAGNDFRDVPFLVRPRTLSAPATAGAVSIDLIGRNARVLGLKPGDEVEITAFCLPPGLDGTSARVVRCDGESARTQAVGLRIRLARGVIGPDFAIRAEAVALPMLDAERRNALLQGAAVAEVTLPVGEDILLRCRGHRCEPILVARAGTRRLARDFLTDSPGTSAPAPALPPDQPVPPDPVSEPASVGGLIVTPTPGEFTLTEVAVGLGLQPVLGLQGVQAGSLINAFEGLPADRSASDYLLSLDPVTSGVARDVLVAYAGPDGEGETSGQLLEDIDLRRRGALVVLDLRPGPDHGAIRAAASYPPFDPALGLWDLQALAAGPLSENPLVPTAWGGLDSRSQPGSSLKIASALALIHTASGEGAPVTPTDAATLVELLRGASPAAVEAAVRLDMAARVQPFARMRAGMAGDIDDRGATPQQLAARARTACERPEPARLGLCEAIVASANSYFAALALYENRSLLDQGLLDPAQGGVTALGGVLRKFGLDRPLPLVRDEGIAGGEPPRQPAVEPVSLPSAPGLAGPPKPTYRIDPAEVALNAYGQNVQITPVAMASLAGAVATGGWVSPYLARAAGAPEPAAIPVVPDDPVAAELLDILRTGMRGVLREGGTGRRSFLAAGEGSAALAERLGAKTGTATISQTGRAYVHWFVGWVDDRDGRPALAFACAISGVAEDKSPCALLVARMLLRLQAKGALP